MNWVTVLSGILKLIPYVTAGIEVIHGEKDTATKTQMAQDALSVASQAAAQVLSPGNAAVAASVANIVSTGIQETQAIAAAVKSQSAPATI